MARTHESGQSTTQRPTGSRRRGCNSLGSASVHGRWVVLPVGAALAASAWWVLAVRQGRSGSAAAETRGASHAAALPQLWRAAEAHDHDVALLNLRCAEGSPGSEDLDLEACVAQLDRWAAHVRSETTRHLYRYRQEPAAFDHSEGYFRMLLMAVVVAEDFGVRYDPDRISGPDRVTDGDGFFADSRGVFLHGLLGPRRLGTCSSMPILYLALGRRLGYPLKLVTTKGHLFLRWEDGRERFNVEATGRGMNRYDDAHYRAWPFGLTEEEVRANRYLESLTAEEELAVFLVLRGLCWREAGRWAEAEEAVAEAVRLAPGVQWYRWLLAEVQSRRLGLADDGLKDPELSGTQPAGAVLPGRQAEVGVGKVKGAR